MTYEEYKAIAELVDLFLKNWINVSSFHPVTDIDGSLKTGSISAYTVLYGKMTKLMQITESYPEFKKKYMEDAGYITPDWAKQLLGG